jgi:large subunit ribosomal protein L4
MSETLPSSRPGPRGPLRRERPGPERRRVTRRDAEGNELGTQELDPEIFGIEPNQAVLHQVVTAQLAAARAGTQSTKTRAEVRGGGAKPYRQKGTGRARQGSTRSPQWTGGGVALGPKPRSYRQATPKRMVRLALRSALSDQAAEDRVALVDRWPWETPRTKDARAALGALGLEGRTLVVLAADDLVARRSFANLPAVQTTTTGELCAYDVVRCDWVVFTDTTLPSTGAAEAPAAEPEVDGRPGADAPPSATTEVPSDTEADGGAATEVAAAAPSEPVDAAPEALPEEGPDV